MLLIRKNETNAHEFIERKRNIFMTLEVIQADTLDTRIQPDTKNQPNTQSKVSRPHPALLGSLTPNVSPEQVINLSQAQLLYQSPLNKPLPIKT